MHNFFKENFWFKPQLDVCELYEKLSNHAWLDLKSNTLFLNKAKLKRNIWDQKITICFSPLIVKLLKGKKLENGSTREQHILLLVLLRTELLFE